MKIKLNYFEASSLRAQGFTLTQLSSEAESLHATEHYWIAPAEIEALAMPAGYKASIRRYLASPPRD